MSNVKYNGSVTTPTNANTYAVTADFTPTDTANYNNLTGASAGNFVINKRNQIITFGALGDKTYGDADFALTATSDSGLAVTYGTTDACSVAGSTLHLTGVGSCTVTASQGGDSNTNPATPVLQSFNIAQKNLTITGLTADNKTYDSTNTATLSGTAALSGVVGSDDVTLSGTPNATFADKNVGTSKPVTVTGYTLSGSTAGNYTLSQPTGLTADITPRDLTVTASATNKSYDGTTGVISNEVQLATDKLSGDTVTPSYTDAAFNGADVGSHTITVNGISISGSDAGNYNLLNTTSTASASIAQQHATVIFTTTNWNPTYSGNQYVVSATATDDGNGNSVPVRVTYDGSSTAPTNAGPYTVLAFVIDSNYYGQTSPAMLTIGKANATVNVTPYSVTYDGTSHTATATATGVKGEDLKDNLDLSGTTQTNAGVYPYSWTFLGGMNYQDQHGTVTDTINKANAQVTVTPYTVTYDGSAHTATGTAIGVNEQEDLNEKLNLTGTAHTNAGVYADPWTFTGDPNYNDQNGTTTDTIAKADAVIVLMPYNVAYDGSIHTATGTATGVLSEDLSAGLDFSGTAHSAVHKYPTDPWTFTDSTGNYNNASGTIANKINLRAPSNDNTGVVGFVFVPRSTTGLVLGVSTTTIGEVLGASTTTEQQLGVTCGIYPNQHLKPGSTNSDQVLKLQQFLVDNGFGTFTPNGHFGPQTLAAVKAFQAKYADSILKPWGLTLPTGLVYLTTARQLNLIECPNLTLPLPPLVPWNQGSSTAQ